ncbi:MAG: fibrobacter succinogenes major paralogous domain-containing protein, partial [Bacteroidales bacterium]|nr:fibrobacter succinogenes major paralogous domain-containing protein [Bacteroidales bacterium]
TSASTTGGTNLGSANGAQTNTFTPPATTVNTDGIYYYAVATDGCGSMTATNNTSGKHIIGPVCPASTNLDANRCTGNGATFTAGIGTQFFKTNTVWTISGNGISQEWSDVVLTSTCGKTDFAGGANPNFNTDCRGNRTTELNETRPTTVNQGGNTANYFGDFFSWCAVVNHAATLCPSPWRVPTCQDFIELDIALGGNGSEVYVATDIVAKYVGTSGNAGQFWGGAYVGFCDNAGTDYQGSDAVYWSSSEANTSNARHLCFVTNGIVVPQGEGNKNDGFALRCVR